MVEYRRKTVLKQAFCFFYNFFHNPLNFNLLLINGNQNRSLLTMFDCDMVHFFLSLLSLQYQNLLINFYQKEKLKLNGLPV